jgi:predicted component of type VI protein secretion system
MKLKLILKGPDRLMGAQIEKTMEHGSLVVGRSPVADWTLPDPERIVSKTHCRIDRDVSGFVLTDTSTNGVEIDNEVVGFGLPRLLSDGNVVKLGDAVILVRLEADAPLQELAQSPRPAAAGTDRDGPFGPAEQAAAPAGAPQPPPMQGAPGQAGSPEPILDDWWAPQESFESSTNPISVDISSNEEQETIRNSIKGQDSLASVSGEATILDLPLTEIESNRLAKAVEAAAANLPDIERQRFYERLRALLLDGSKFLPE